MRGEEVFDDFVDVRDVVGENGQAEAHEAVEVLTMSCRGSEPREFKKQELKELMVLIFMNYNSYRFKNNLHPNPQSLRLLFGVQETLSVNDRIILLGIFLKSGLM